MTGAASLQRTVEPAPAKLNLWLEVLGRRPGGHHALRSLAEPLAWCDAVEVTLETLPGDAPGAEGDAEVTCRCPGHPALDGAQNLAARAAARLLDGRGRRYRCDLVVHKVIPVGAGLGGGSADAAATLRALGRLLGPTGPTPAHRAAVAEGLGADVPFCLRGEAALMEGVGERLTPVTLPTHGLCLLLPGVALSTAEMFARLDAPDLPEGPAPQATATPWRAPVTLKGLAAEVTARGNAFWEVALATEPPLGRALAALRAEGPLAAGLSGSGAALFGVFGTLPQAEAAAEALRGAGWTAVGVTPAPSPAPTKG